MASEAPALKEAFPSPLTLPPRCPPSDRMEKILGPLAINAYFLSLPVLGYGIWLLATREYECENLLRMPAMLFLFAISNVVVYYGRRVLMPGHSILSIALVAMLTVGLSLVATYKMHGVPGNAGVANVATGEEFIETVGQCIQNCDLDEQIHPLAASFIHS